MNSLKNTWDVEEESSLHKNLFHLILPYSTIYQDLELPNVNPNATF